MRILSLDPGHTTGIAILNESGDLEVSMAVPKETVFRRGFLSSLIRMSDPDVVLLEGLPTRMVDPITQDIWSHFSKWFNVAGYKVEIIQPSQWKGLVERVEIPGQHARDAASMAKWYVKSQRG